MRNNKLVREAFCIKLRDCGSSLGERIIRTDDSGEPEYAGNDFREVLRERCVCMCGCVGVREGEGTYFQIVKKGTHKPSSHSVLYPLSFFTPSQNFVFV